MNGISIKELLESKQGDTITVQCSEADFISSEEYQKLYGSEDSEEEKTEESFMDYEIDTKESLAILHLRQCIYNEEYRNCLKKLFEEVKEKQIKNVAVDLRDNGGGNSANQHGEIVYFKLANSKLLMNISTKLFHRVDKECKDKLVYPDRECDADLAIDELYKAMKGA